MFQQFGLPFINLCAYEPIRGNSTLMGLVSEAQRRLRQLDRFHDQAWDYIHRSIAMQPSRDEFLADPTLADDQTRCNEYAYDAAKIFYLFSHRVLDITRSLKKIPKIPIILCGSQFWKPLLKFIDQTVYAESSAINKTDMDLYLLSDNHEEIIKLIKNSHLNQI